MSENSTQSLQVVPAKTQTSVREKLGKVGLVAGTFAVANAAHAVPVLDFSGATAELTGAQAGIVALIGILLTITGIVIAWRTFRSGAR